MNNEEKLKLAFEKVVWMAIRYAHGRSTAAPSMVRSAIALMQSVDPDWKPRPDDSVKFNPGEMSGMSLRSDYLDDLFNDLPHPWQ